MNSIKRVDGEKLFLRPIEMADIDRGWLRWINDPAVNGNLASSEPVTRADLETYHAKSQPPSAFMFAICERSTDDYVGNIRLSAIDRVNHKATYGWLIGDASKRGRGYGTEALILMLRFAFEELNLNRISTAIVEDNTASLRANKTAGFVQEGLLREYVCKDEIFRNAVQVSILRSEYEARYGRASG